MNLTDKLELLAPAGNLECLHAAVSAGADAVYLGIDEFNARRNADNFILDSLADACDYAHLRNVSIYVTLNVEILPRELDRAVETACQAYLAGADALIVQDIGLASAVAQALPQTPIHASTQMNIHNAAGVEAAARLGARRVTLARELSLEEIAELSAIAASFGMETECFAHGALCVCYSGQCLMSSMIGGRSANRGLCAQACRLPYELHREGRDAPLPAEGKHLLSPRDLCAIGLLDDLVRAGVSSLKVEGRMKSADYVHEVVSVYREVLDSGKHALPEHEARLHEAFSRGFTTAYLEGDRSNAIMGYGRPNNRGVFIGRVTRSEHDHASVIPETSLNEGDIVEFWTNKGRFTATVAQTSPAGEPADIPVAQRTGKGDRVFRVRNAATAFIDDPFEPRVPVSGHIDLRIGKPARIRFETQGHISAVAEGDIVEAARTRAVSEDDVRAHVDRLGQTPFTLKNLSVNLQEGVGIGFSALHRLRNEALQRLNDELLSYHKGRTVEPHHRPCASERTRRDACSITAWAANPTNARAARRGGAANIYVPLLNFKRGQAQTEGVLREEAEQAGYPKQCIMALPAIDHDPVAGTREYASPFDMWDYVKAGKTVFADSLAGAIRALQSGADVEVGPHVPVTNRATLEYLAGLGISRVWLSPELSLGQIAELAASSPIALGLFVSGAQELMITEHCLLMSQGPCDESCETCPRRKAAHKLVDQKGFDFPVVTDLFGRSHLYNGIELDAVASLPDLVDIGISAFMVDTTLMGKKDAEAAVRRATRALELARTSHQSVVKRTNTTTGHLFRGVL